jgi:hypothetical protein
VTFRCGSGSEALFQKREDPEPDPDLYLWLLDPESESWRPKNMQILRIWIPNSGKNVTLPEPGRPWWAPRAEERCWRSRWPLRHTCRRRPGPDATYGVLLLELVAPDQPARVRVQGRHHISWWDRVALVGVFNMSVVIHNLYCIRGSGLLQETSGQNLKVIIIIMIYTKHNHYYHNHP